VTAYARGATFERTVKADLEKFCPIVVRSAGSHGAVDLIACHQNAGAEADWWLVQCKINGKMSPAEREELYRIAEQCNAWAVIVSRPKRGAILYERLFTHGKTQRVEIYP
jgi:Holliday junction resolvase